MSDIKYLIKFVSKKNYAEDLVAGKLFMRPASYYHILEQRMGAGQGDLGEAGIVDGICIYKHSHLPIYCLYTVMKNDIIENEILISERCIDDFHCQDGYAVLIDYKKWEPMLSKINTEGYELDAGLVSYHKLSTEDTMALLNDNTPRNLFIKRPFFSYQKEYRIVICNQVYKDNESPINEKTYWFSEPLDESAKIISIPSLTQINGNYVIKL